MMVDECEMVVRWCIYDGRSVSDGYQMVLDGVYWSTCVRWLSDGCQILVRWRQIVEGNHPPPNHLLLTIQGRVVKWCMKVHGDISKCVRWFSVGV
jgi:hypothetical protein